jgi:hypothetical protein
MDSSKDQPQTTAGLDIGDNYSYLCLLDTLSGEVLWRRVCSAHHPRGLQRTLRLRAAHAHSNRGRYPLALGEQGA